MTRSLSLALLLVIGGLFMLSASNGTVAQNPVPTLIPPTPIPRDDSGIGEILPTQSAVARIQERGVAKVGILFNAPPFAELNIRGELRGFDADLARLMAEAWGVEVEFVQITRDMDVAIERLRIGEIDFLVGALINHRDLTAALEFSQAYYLGQKSVMVRGGDSEPQSLADLQSRRVGVVIATPAETSLRSWMARTDSNFDIQTYLTLDEAFTALVAREIDGVVDSDYRLNHVSVRQPEGVKLLTESIEFEPYAIGIQRQDINLRQLINRTLQYLTAQGEMQAIYQEYFPGRAFRAVDIWDNIGQEAPRPVEYASNIELPDEFVVGSFVSDPVLRVAGLLGVTADSEATESEVRLDTFHRSLVEEIARRWGVTVTYVTDSTLNAIDLVANGEADIAIGIAPDWNHSEEVSFTSHYLRHGFRLMIRSEDENNIRGFGDISGELLVTPVNEANTVDYARSIAEARDWRLDFAQQREADLGFVLLGGDEELEPEAVFADSMKLVPHIEEHPDELMLTDMDTGAPRWYAPSQIEGEDFTYRMMVMAVPRNDVDFRLLVEFTLQELARDGTLANLLTAVMPEDEIPMFEIWPGPQRYLGIPLTSGG